MRSRFLTEADLLHFTRNGARVRGGVQAPIPGKRTLAGRSADGCREAGGHAPVAQAPSSSRYEYNGQAYKSKTEVRFAQYLDALKFGGEIVDWQYEPVNVRLPGKKNYYKPDFLVVRGSGLTFYDTKGFNRSDARSLVKIKTAAGLNLWAQFAQVRWLKGAWIERRIDR